MVLEMMFYSPFNHLTLLLARESFAEFIHSEISRLCCILTVRNVRFKMGYMKVWVCYSPASAFVAKLNQLSIDGKGTYIESFTKYKYYKSNLVKVDEMKQVNNLYNLLECFNFC